MSCPEGHRCGLHIERRQTERDYCIGCGRSLEDIRLERRQEEIEELREIYDAAKLVVIAHLGKRFDNETKGEMIDNLRATFNDYHKCKRSNNKQRKPNIKQ